MKLRGQFPHLVAFRKKMKECYGSEEDCQGYEKKHPEAVKEEKCVLHVNSGTVLWFKWLKELPWRKNPEGTPSPWRDFPFFLIQSLLTFRRYVWALVQMVSMYVKRGQGSKMWLLQKNPDQKMQENGLRSNSNIERSTCYPESRDNALSEKRDHLDFLWVC